VRRAALLALLAGCVVPDPAPRFTPAWEPFDPSGKEWRTTRKALLVSDCQFHNLLSKPLPERNLAIKALVGTAIRPPQLDLFSRDVLSWILADGAPDADVVLHLGDALDLACTGEFDTFLEVMASAKKPWFMAPGNHDAYYFGNFDPEDKRLWQEAAYGAGEIMTKDKFIRAYVAALKKQDDEGARAFAAAVPDPLPAVFEWRAEPATKGFLDAVAWSIDAERPWRSFLIQQIDLTGPAPDDPHISCYLLDSCQYDQRPELTPNAWQCYPLHHNCGVTGEMLPDQLRMLKAWVDDGGARGHGVLMCHHPFMSLAPRSRSSLGWLWREHRIGLMVTAHTHEGWFRHHDLGGGPERLELNLGSTTDWPMEWRTLEGYAKPGGDTYIRAQRYTLVEMLREKGGYFLRDWEVPLDAPDDYRHYKQGEATPGLIFDFYLVHHVTPRWMNQPNVKPNKAARATEAAVKDTMLHTYDRLVRTFPTDPAKAPPWPPGCDSDDAVLGKIRTTVENPQLEAKIALLKELGTFERGRHTIDPKTGESTDDARFRYRISQAAWASRFEKAKGRRLRVEDDLIRVAER